MFFPVIKICIYIISTHVVSESNCDVLPFNLFLLFFGQGERTFSEEEEEKLQTALSLDKQALSLVVETSAFILEQV